MLQRISRFTLFFSLYSIISAENMKSLMETHQVVPDLIPKAPETTLNVIYDGGLAVANGAELTPTQVKSQPTVTWDFDENTFYALLLICPDIPTRTDKIMRDLRTWIVVNIPGNDISKGDVITEYVGSGAPAGTGLHRYVFLLYKQSSKMAFDEERITKNTFKGRYQFSTQKFVEKYNLGVPIAGNFFQAQYDDYVPEVHKQLGVICDNESGISICTEMVRGSNYLRL